MLKFLRVRDYRENRREMMEEVERRRGLVSEKLKDFFEIWQTREEKQLEEDSRLELDKIKVKKRRKFYEISLPLNLVSWEHFNTETFSLWIRSILDNFRKSLRPVGLNKALREINNQELFSSFRMIKTFWEEFNPKILTMLKMKEDSRNTALVLEAFKEIFLLETLKKNLSERWTYTQDYRTLDSWEEKPMYKLRKRIPKEIQDYILDSLKSGIDLSSNADLKNILEYFPEFDFYVFELAKMCKDKNKCSSGEYAKLLNEAREKLKWYLKIYRTFQVNWNNAIFENACLGKHEKEIFELLFISLKSSTGSLWDIYQLENKVKSLISSTDIEYSKLKNDFSVIEKWLYFDSLRGKIDEVLKDEEISNLVEYLPLIHHYFNSVLGDLNLSIEDLDKALEYYNESLLNTRGKSTLAHKKIMGCKLLKDYIQSVMEDKQNPEKNRKYRFKVRIVN